MDIKNVRGTAYFQDPMWSNLCWHIVKVGDMVKQIFALSAFNWFKQKRKEWLNIVSWWEMDATIHTLFAGPTIGFSHEPFKIEHEQRPSTPNCGFLQAYLQSKFSCHKSMGQSIKSKVNIWRQKKKEIELTTAPNLLQLIIAQVWVSHNAYQSVPRCSSRNLRLMNK